MQKQPSFPGFIMLFAYATCGYKNYLGKAQESTGAIYGVISCTSSPCNTGILHDESRGTELRGIYKIL